MGQPENIDALLVKYDITQQTLSEIAGVAPSAISRWRQGAQMRQKPLEKICDYFSLTIDDILSDEFGLAAKEHGSKAIECTDIPYYGAIAAGVPISIDTAECTMPCPNPIYKKHPHSFFLRVQGGSMDRVVPDGSLALIDADDKEPSGSHIYACCINGDSATLKRVRKLANGLELIPDSTDPTQRSIIFDYSQDHEEVTIAGRLVWYMAPFDFEV